MSEVSENVLEVRHLCKYFPIKAGLFSRVVGHVHAVEDVSFTLKRGTTMGLVGESGCGKTTVGKTLLNLTPKTSGDVIFNGSIELDKLSSRELRAFRPKIQIIFQDPYSSLSPRLPVGEIIGEAVREHHLVPDEELDDYITKIMKACGLHEYQKDRYPHEFSGGQRQRICIARAIALNPDRHGRRDVPGQHGGVRGEGGDLCQSSPSLHAGALQRDPRAGPHGQDEPHHPGGHDPLAGQPALRLQVPHPLPQLQGRLQPEGPEDDGYGQRAHRRLPHLRSRERL